MNEAEFRTVDKHPAVYHEPGWMLGTKEKNQPGSLVRDRAEWERGAIGETETDPRHTDGRATRLDEQTE